MLEPGHITGKENEITASCKMDQAHTARGLGWGYYQQHTSAVESQNHHRTTESFRLGKKAAKIVESNH